MLGFREFFLSLSPEKWFSSHLGRDKELKGNPVKIRNYPRSCKFYLSLQRSVVTFIKPLVHETDREGATTKTSQKTCRFISVIQCFRVKSYRTSPLRFILLLGLRKLSCMNNYVGVE